MGKYPVIFISLKDVEGLSYDEAFQVFSRIIGNEISKFSFLAESDKLTVWEKEQFKGLLTVCYFDRLSSHIKRKQLYRP